MASHATLLRSEKFAQPRAFSCERLNPKFLTPLRSKPTQPSEP